MKQLRELLGPSTSVLGMQYDYDPGDSRSHGSLNVTFQVEGLGEVKFEGTIGTSGGYDGDCGGTAFVNGEEVGFSELPEVSAPHYYSGDGDWEETAVTTLTEEFARWLDNERLG